MLINTVYVDGGSAVISVVTGLHDCDGRICVPFLEMHWIMQLNM